MFVGVVFLCRLVAANVIVPPWQGPDEPTHFALAKLTMPADAIESARVVEIEGQILQSMRRHDWWLHYDRPTPVPFPASFADVPNDLFRGTADQPAYYQMAGVILRVAADEASVEDQYFALRTLSVVLTLLTMVFGWLGTRAWFDERIAAAAVAIVALHPQFLLSAISVNPDALINCCGAFVWWQVTRLRDRRQGHRAVTVALLCGACIVAALSKRNGLPLVLLAAAGGVVVGAFDGRRNLLLAGFVCALVVGAGATLAYAGGPGAASLQRLVTYWTSVFRPGEVDVSASRFVQFGSAAVDTAWLTAGWLRFPPPAWWSWTARILTVLGIAGIIPAVIARRRSALAAFSFVAIHVGSLLLVAFIAGSAPQGRYLFAVLFPAAALLLCGMRRWLGPALGEARAIATTVGVVGVLDFTGFLLVLLPAYAH